jgi:hypothetical protein
MLSIYSTLFFMGKKTPSRSWLAGVVVGLQHSSTAPNRARSQQPPTVQPQASSIFLPAQLDPRAYSKLRRALLCSVHPVINAALTFSARHIHQSFNRPTSGTGSHFLPRAPSKLQGPSHQCRKVRDNPCYTDLLPAVEQCSDNS